MNKREDYIKEVKETLPYYDIVSYKNTTIFLNARMLKNQNIKEDGFKALIELHKQKIDLETSDSILENINALYDVLESKAQVIWGFNVDKKFHYWSLQHPKCICPKMDNEERIGATTDRVYVTTCPVHKFLVKD